MLRIALLTVLLTALTTATGQPWVGSDAELAARYRVNGVRVSAHSQIAIINDQLLGIGEQIADAVIVAIEANVVHLRVAERTFAMRVGSSLIRDSRFADTVRKPERVAERTAPTRAAIAEARAALAEAAATSAQSSAAHQVTEEQPASVPLVPSEPTDQVPATRRYGPVAPGETLSEIAASLTHGTGGFDAFMAETFALNPQAFGASIDVLFAGAQLTLPRAGPAAITARAPPQAAPLVPLTVKRERLTHRAATRIVQVVGGDTLSEIAAAHHVDGITLNQAMLAIFAANPASFGANLNLLYAGKTLIIPDFKSINHVSANAALRMVQRHTAAWTARIPASNST